MKDIKDALALDEDVRDKVYGGVGEDNDQGLRNEALETYNIVNNERQDAGLDPLSWDQNLETVASVREKESSRAFYHNRPNGSQWNTVNSQIQGGENLAWGQTSANEVVDELMNSPTHRDNILYDEFSNMATGTYRNEDGTDYWTKGYGK